MYEFNSKEIREKFKKTEYGKKLNKMLIIVSGLFVFFCLIELFTQNINFIKLILLVLFIFVAYFDGKRDGAIEQFKRNKKK